MSNAWRLLKGLKKFLGNNIFTYAMKVTGIEQQTRERK